MDNSIGDLFKRDKRIGRAKKLIVDTILEYQKSITDIKPRSKNKNLAKSYHKMLEKFAELRGGSLYYPYISSGIGKGALVELADGSVKLDFITGIGVHYFGHSDPAVIQAAIDAACEDTLMQGNLQQSVKSAELLQRLIKLARKGGSKLRHGFLTSSGAMANENALKMAFQKHHPAARVLAFEKCFSGRTLACAQITDKAANRVGQPKTLEVDYVPFFDGTNKRSSIKKSLSVLRKHLQRYPGKHAAMIFELIQGEGGYYPGSREFFVALMDLLKSHGIAVIVDEIQTFGRTECPFAFQKYELEKYVDIVTIGKMSQICATLFTKNYCPRPGLVSQTFTSATSAICAAELLMKQLEKGSLFGPQGKILRIHGRFAGHLRRLSKKYPKMITGPYGYGAMIACTVCGGDLNKTKSFLMKLFENGLIAFLAGSNPYRVRFLPPVLSVTNADIDKAALIIEHTIKDCRKKRSK